MYICNNESGCRRAARETSRRINILFRFPLRKRLRHAIYLSYFRAECSLAGPQRQVGPARVPLGPSTRLARHRPHSQPSPTSARAATLAAPAALLDRRLLTYDYRRREAS